MSATSARETEALLIRHVVATNTGGRYTEESLSGAMNLKDIGIDSLKFIVMILELESKLSRKIFNVANLSATRTLDDLLQIALPDQQKKEDNHDEAS